jgi:hypothetical protein
MNLFDTLVVLALEMAITMPLHGREKTGRRPPLEKTSFNNDLPHTV